MTESTPITGHPIGTFDLPIVRYHDWQDNPTCAANFETGEVCTFYRTQRMGCHETCIFAEEHGGYGQAMNRRQGGKGTLIPLAQCPIWATPERRTE